MKQMKRRLILAASVALAASNAWAQEHPTTVPAVAPASAHATPAAAPALTAAPTASAVNFGDRYGILSEKNIFVRNRPATRTPGERRPARRQEETMVLTGIALQEGRHVAFLEDSAARQTKRLLPGDQIAGGTIADVSFDSMEFEVGGKRVHINVGRNLLGEIAPAAPVPVADASSQPAVASTGSPERTASDRNSNSNSSRSSSTSSNRDSRSRDSRSRDSRGNTGSSNRDSRNGNTRDSRTNVAPAPRDTLRERDPAAPPPESTAAPAPAAGSAAAPALPNDPNLSLEERLKLRRQQLGGEK